MKVNSKGEKKTLLEGLYCQYCNIIIQKVASGTSPARENLQTLCKFANQYMTNKMDKFFLYPQGSGHFENV